MNVHVRPRSRAAEKYRAFARIPVDEDIAGGLAPTRSHDLHFHGGRTIPALNFSNFYVGADAWQQADMDAIDAALQAAMSEPTLNNVMAQYFATMPTSAFGGSQKLPGAAPALMSQGDVENLVTSLHAQGTLDGADFTSTVFNFMLPPGTVLTDSPTPGGQDAPDTHAEHRRGVPEEEEVDSLHGLGGYHGSVVIGADTVYYAVGVYSETANGQTNGIPVFDAAWKNVVATFYHELNEARTDPDVQLVINGGASSLLGWTSRQGEECGDFPVSESDPNLDLVFQEVPLTGGGTAPVQFQYSDAVHGPEGPIDQAHAPIKHKVA
jgi:hypothetical protein